MQTMGVIQVNEEVDGLGQIEDISGTKWDVISVWPNGEYVTACETDKMSDSYSRFRPYEIQIVNED